MKLSIIIPVYNTAKFLKKCLDSCVNQNFSSSDYEIIIVNDGSTDESHIICSYYKERYSNIKYIKQKNSGLSVVRNNGLDIATGEYVWFVDSDDWIKDNCINTIYNNCHENDLDVLSIGYKKIDDSYSSVIDDSIQIQPLSILSGKQILKTNFVFGVPLYIFKKKYLKNNNIVFIPKIYHEDNEYTPKALYYADKIGVTNEMYYFYYTRGDSITKNMNPKKCFDLLIVCKSLVNFSKYVDADLQPYINNVITTSFNTALAYAKEMDSTSKVELMQQISLNTEIFEHMIKSKSIKFQIEGLLFSLFPNNVLKFYALLKR